MEIRNLPDLCHDHLRRAGAIYRSDESEDVKKTTLKALLLETETCKRCQRLRHDETEPKIMNRRIVPSWNGTNLVETPPSDLEFFSSRQRRVEEFMSKGLFPLPTLPVPLRSKLFELSPPVRNARLGATQLEDSFVLPRVIFIDEEYILKWFTSFPGHFVRGDKVKEIFESPFRMPTAICDRLAAVGETSMSSLEFWIILRNGERVPCWYGGYNPFIELSRQNQPNDIVDVEVGRRSVVGEEAVLAEPDFVWCVYK